MSCSSCGSEYCDGEKCDENGGQDPFPDPVEDDSWGDDDDEDTPDEEDEDLDVEDPEEDDDEE